MWSRILLLLLLFFAGIPSLLLVLSSSLPACSDRPDEFDLVWLIDGSYTAMEDQSFSNFTALVRDYASTLPANARHGFVVYGGSSQQLGATFPLSTDRAGFLDALDLAQPLGGAPDQAPALDRAKQMLADASGGSGRFQAVVLIASLPAQNGFGSSLVPQVEHSIAQLTAADASSVLVYVLQVGDASDWAGGASASSYYAGVTRADTARFSDFEAVVPSLLLCGLTLAPSHAPTSSPTLSPVYQLPLPMDVLWVVQSSAMMDDMYVNITEEIASFSHRFVALNAAAAASSPAEINQLGFVEFSGPTVDSPSQLVRTSLLPLTSDAAQFVGDVYQASAQGSMGGTTNIQGVFEHLGQVNAMPPRAGAHQVVVLVLTSLPTDEQGTELDDVGSTEEAVRVFKQDHPGVVLVLLRLAFLPEHAWFLSAEADYVYDLQLPLNLFSDLQVLNLELTFAPSAAPTAADTEAPSPAPSPAPTASAAPVPATPQPTQEPETAQPAITLQPTVSPTAPTTRAPTTPTVDPDYECRLFPRSSQVVWLLQVSNSVSQWQVQIAKQFMADFMAAQSSSTSQVEFGFLAYAGPSDESSAAPLVVQQLALQPASTMSDPAGFLGQVSALAPVVDGANKMADALDAALAMFSSSPPPAADVERTIVLFLYTSPSDESGAPSEQTKQATEDKIAELQLQHGVNVVAVNLDSAAEAGFPSTAHKLHEVDSSLNLASALHNNLLCSDDTEAPTESPTAYDCVSSPSVRRPMDVFFLLQASFAMQDLYTNVTQQLAWFAANKMQTATPLGSVHAGYLEFSGLDQFGAGTEILDVLPIPTTGNSDGAAAFAQAMEQAAASGRGATLQGSTDVANAFEYLASNPATWQNADHGHPVVLVLVLTSLPTDVDGMADNYAYIEHTRERVANFKSQFPQVSLALVRVNMDMSHTDFFLEQERDYVVDVTAGGGEDALAKEGMLLCWDVTNAPSEAPTAAETFEPTASPFPIGGGEATSQPTTLAPTTLQPTTLAPTSTTPTSSPTRATYAPGQSPAHQEECVRNSDADYVFLVQTSNSVSADMLTRTTEFISRFLTQVWSTSSGESTRIGLVSYAAPPQNVANVISASHALGALGSVAAFDSARAQLTSQGGLNLLAAALEYVDTNMLATARLPDSAYLVIFLASDPSEASGVQSTQAIADANAALAVLKQRHAGLRVVLVSPQAGLDPTLLASPLVDYRYEYFTEEHMAALMPQFLCGSVPTTLAPVPATMAPATGTMAPQVSSVPSQAPTQYRLNAQDFNEWRRFRSQFPNQTFCPFDAADVCNACGPHNSTERYVVCDVMPTPPNAGRRRRRQLGQTIDLRISKIRLRNSQLVANLTTRPLFVQLDELDLITDTCLENSNRIYVQTEDACDGIPRCRLDTLNGVECGEPPLPPADNDDEGTPVWLIILLLLLLLCCLLCCLLLLCLRRRKKREEERLAEEKRKEAEFFKYNDVEDGDYDPTTGTGAGAALLSPSRNKRAAATLKKKSYLGVPFLGAGGGGGAGGDGDDVWEEHVDPDTGTKYYLNRRTGEFRWDKPPALDGGEEDVWVKKYHEASGTSYFQNVKTGETSHTKPGGGENAAGGGNNGVFDTFPYFAGISKMGDTLRRTMTRKSELGANNGTSQSLAAAAALAAQDDDDERGSRGAAAYSDGDLLDESGVPGSAANARRGSTVPGVKTKPLGRFNRHKKSDTLDETDMMAAMNPMFGQGGQGNYPSPQHAQQQQKNRGMTALNPAFAHGDLTGEFDDADDDDVGVDESEAMFGTPLANQHAPQSRKNRLAAMLAKKQQASPSTPAAAPHDPFADMQSSMNPAFAHGALMETSEMEDPNAALLMQQQQKSTPSKTLFGFSWGGSRNNSKTDSLRSQQQKMEMFSENPAFYERGPIHSGRSKLDDLVDDDDDDDEEEDRQQQQRMASVAEVDERRRGDTDLTVVESPSDDEDGGNAVSFNPLFAAAGSSSSPDNNKVRFASAEAESYHQSSSSPASGPGEMSEFEKMAFLATGAAPMRGVREEDINEDLVRKPAADKPAAAASSSFFPGILRTKSTNDVSAAAAAGGGDRRTSSHRVVETPSTGLFHVQPNNNTNNANDGDDDDDEEELTIFQREKLLRSGGKGADLVYDDDGSGNLPQRKSSSKKDFRIVRDSKSALKRMSFTKKSTATAADDDDDPAKKKDDEPMGVAGRVKEMKARFDGTKQRRSVVEKNQLKAAHKNEVKQRVVGEIGGQGRVEQTASRFGKASPATATATLAPVAAPVAVAAAAVVAAPAPVVQPQQDEDEDDEAEEVLWIEDEDEDNGQVYWMDADTGEFTFVRPTKGVFTSAEVLYAAGKDVVPRQSISREQKQLYKAVQKNSTGPMTPDQHQSSAWDLLQGGSGSGRRIGQQQADEDTDDEEEEEYTPRL